MPRLSTIFNEVPHFALVDYVFCIDNEAEFTNTNDSVLNSSIKLSIISVERWSVTPTEKYIVYENRKP